MKKIALIMMVTTVSIGAMAQGKVVEKYFTKFENDETFTKVSISSKMFSLFTEMEGNTEEEQEFLEMIGKLKGIKAVTSEQVSNPSQLYKDAISDVEKDGYEELMTVKDAEENVRIAIKDTNGTIEELILIMGGKEKFALMSLYGEIDLKQVSKLAGSMRINGMQYLDKMDDDDPDND